MDEGAQYTGAARRDWLLSLSGEDRRDERLSVDAYISPEYLRLEKERLWPKVWQIACREEEIPDVGDFVEYTIFEESIVVVRAAPDRINAFYNVCQHRGRRLVKGRGAIRQFRCPFHMWRYTLEGECAEIYQGDDYVSLCREDVSLKPVRVDIWQGWVFVNMDPDAEPLLDYLAPVPEYIDPYEIGKMRLRWHKTVIVPCNWKTAQEAFIENYHVASVHPQLLPYVDDRALSFRHGKHSHYTMAPDNTGFATPAPQLNVTTPKPAKKLLLDFLELQEADLKAMFTPLDIEAMKRLKDLPDDTPAGEVFVKMVETVREIMSQDGSGGLTISLQQMMRAGADWHVFPNHVFLPTHSGVLAYRFRLNGDDPNSAIFDIYSLMRYPAGQEPPLKHEFYAEWSEKGLGRVLTQDYANMEATQLGMHSRGFSGSRPNPVQESAIANYHRALQEYLNAPSAPKPDSRG